MTVRKSGIGDLIARHYRAHRTTLVTAHRAALREKGYQWTPELEQDYLRMWEALHPSDRVEAIARAMQSPWWHELTVDEREEWQRAVYMPVDDGDLDDEEECRLTAYKARMVSEQIAEQPVPLTSMEIRRLTARKDRMLRTERGE